MLEASEATTRWTPELAAAMALVGELGADAVLALARYTGSLEYS